MAHFLSDLRRAGRVLRHHPGFAAFVVLTLALAIGATTSIFAVVRSVLLRPLPFAEPERLVRLWESNSAERREFENVSPANFLDWQAQNRSFEDLAFWRDTPVTLAGQGEPVEVTAEAVSANLFELLGVEALHGRPLLPAEGREKVVVVSHALWRTTFASDTGLVGRTIRLNREPHVVVGVMPPGFNVLGRSIAVWYPEEFEPGQFRRRHYLEVVGRLRPGTSLAAARTDLETVAGRLATEYPETNDGWGVRLAPLHEQVVGSARRPLLTLLVAAGCVLLVACANIAALLLARATRRERELAVRTALGAERRDLVRQLLAESLLLALTAGSLGYLLVAGGLRLLLTVEPGDLPRVHEVEVGLPVFLFACGLSLVTVAVFGVHPALRASKQRLGSRLREGGGPRTGRGPRHNLVLRMLTVGEIAVAVLLLISAGLLLHSFVRLRVVDPGFRSDYVLVGRVSLDKAAYPEDPLVLAYFERLLDRLRSLPGVEAAGAATTLPFQPVGIDFEAPYTVAGGTAVTEEEGPQVAFRVVSPGYFEALGVRLTAGRAFDARDRADSPPVAIVNRRMARQAWPEDDPLGRRVGLFTGAADEFEVVGVVADIHHYGLGAEPRPEIFVPQAQHPWYDSFYVAVRTAGRPEALHETVQRAVLTVDPAQPIADLLTMERLLAESLARERFLTLLLGLMAALALFLAITGIYAVLSYGVSQRVHEIGVRLAVGARPADILKLVLRDGCLLALTGLLLGLAGARAAVELLGSFLFEISTGDLATYAGVAAVFLAASLAACYLPARRAARTDPIRALGAG